MSKTDIFGGLAFAIFVLSFSVIAIWEELLFLLSF